MGSAERGFPGEEWFRVAFANAAVGLLIVDGEGRILYANDSYCHLIGRTCDELMGLCVWTLMVPEDALLSRDAMANLARQGTGSYVAHRRYVHKNGHLVWVRGTVSVAPGDGGRQPVLAIVVEDDTERVRLHRELEFQASLLDHVRNAVIATDSDGRITHWNRHAESIYQWTREEVIGRPVFEVNTPAAAREESAKILQKVAETGHWEGEFTARRKDGTPVPIYATLSPIRDGINGVNGYVGVSNDITEWNAGAGKCQMQPDPVGAGARGGRPRHLGPGLQTGLAVRSFRHDEIFGYDHPAPRWGLETLLDHVHAEDRLRVKEVIEAAIREGMAASSSAGSSGSDGAVAWIWIRGKFQYDASGAKTRLTGVIRDITYRKLREQQMQETQKLESLGILAGGIAHDFNNLLAGVIGNASLAETTVPADHEIHEYLNGIIHAGERAAHLTQQMLAYAGKGRLLSAAIDMNQTVQELSSLMHSSIPNKVLLRLELTPDLPRIEGDPGQIQQVVMNLLLNAAEAIPQDSEGFITIRTGMASPDGESQVYLEVRDTGIGMDEETRRKIFDPFFTTKFLGRGLGLAAVQGAIRAHRGTIAVESEPGRGTMFRVMLPVGEPPRREKTAPRAQTESTPPRYGPAGGG